MDHQAFFDKTVAHLRTQGRRAYDVNFATCRYRGPDGTKCAFGVHIPDDMYDEAMEGINAEALVASTRWPLAELLDVHAVTLMDHDDFTVDQKLILDLQRLHDHGYMAVQNESPFMMRVPTEVEVVASWEEGFLHIAAKFSLTYTAPSEG